MPLPHDHFVRITHGGSIQTMTIGKTHLTLEKCQIRRNLWNAVSLNEMIFDKMTMVSLNQEYGFETDIIKNLRVHFLKFYESLKFYLAATIQLQYCFGWLHLFTVLLQHKDKVPLIGFKLELTKLGISTIVAVRSPKIESLLG